jgi:hypothetical protein
MVFTTHSPRWHQRPALHGVPSAQGMYCVRQPACSPMSVVHHSRLHTGYNRCRKLPFKRKTHLQIAMLLKHIRTLQYCNLFLSNRQSHNSTHDSPGHSKHISSRYLGIPNNDLNLLMFFLKPLYATKFLCSILLCTNLLHVSAPIGGHLQVKCTQNIYIKVTTVYVNGSIESAV